MAAEPSSMPGDCIGEPVSARIQKREEFLIPSLAPYGMACRAIIHREGGMYWRWFRTIAEAQEWLGVVAPNAIRGH